VARTTNREPDFLAVDFKAPRKSDFALGTARDAHLLLQELEAKKQLASRKRHAENEERGGNKNHRAAAETKNQNRQQMERPQTSSARDKSRQTKTNRRFRSTDIRTAMTLTHEHEQHNRAKKQNTIFLLRRSYNHIIGIPPLFDY
jgi:hypothetical protein